MNGIQSKLIPSPHFADFSEDSVRIANIAEPLFVFRPENRAGEVFRSAVHHLEQALQNAVLTDRLRADSGYEIVLKVDPDDEAFADLQKAEAYRIEIDETGAIICGIDDAGAFYGAITFAKLIEADANGVFLPKGTVVDYPDFPHRGNFEESRYGTEFKTLQNWMDDIDYYASLKFNYLMIGVHGCWTYQYDGRPQQYLYVPLKCYPQLETRKVIKYYSVKEERYVYKDNILPPICAEDFLGEIIAYGKKKNITVVPLFNSLGHNTYLPKMFPEAAAKNEDGTATGFGFCTNSAQTYELMFHIYDEIIERYLAPNGIDAIHIGMDEVGKAYICHCEQCRDQTHKELMIDYLIRICKHLKEKGMKHIYIYHDMLYHTFNAVNEELKARFIREGLYDEVVLDWWSYEDPKHLFWDRADGVNNLFRSIAKPFTGYYHWVIPTDSNDNIRAMAKLSKEKNFEGMNGYGIYAQPFDKNFHCMSEACWNVDAAQDKEGFNRRYAAYRFPKRSEEAAAALDALEDIMKDETGELYMNRACWRFEYYHYSYKKNEIKFPQVFPGNVFKFIYENEAECLAYFKFLKEKSRLALDFFEQDGSLTSSIAGVWLLTAKHYYVLADEYLTLHRIDRQYNDGTMDAAEALTEFKRLFAQREALMELAETVRSPERACTYLRNMSVFRQYYADNIAYFEQAISQGVSPEFGIVDFELQKSAVYDFLK